MILKILDHLEDGFIATLMAAATLIIFVAVVHRYAAGVSIPGIQDFLISLNLSWARTLHLHVHMDGEDRRRVRRADRHSRWRRCFNQCAEPRLA